MNRHVLEAGGWGPMAGGEWPRITEDAVAFSWQFWP
jgi:hypothetical protein